MNATIARRIAAVSVLIGASMVAACTGGPAPNVARAFGRSRQINAGIGLGKILSTKDGGQIFGFDVDRNGRDGILASARDTSKPGVYRVSVETFDQTTGRITGLFAGATGTRNSYGIDGIFAGGVALVTHYVEAKGTIYAIRKFATVDPLAARRFTGRWTPPVKDIDVASSGRDQNAATTVLFGIELKRRDRPDLVVSDVGANTFAKVIPLDENLFGAANGPQLGQYTAANEAVLALSPDAGAVGGLPPVNVLVDMTTGKSLQFNGYNNGYYHAGAVNGLAVDPNTGIAVSDTELNAQVEFYDLQKRTGIVAVQLPCSGSTSQGNSGAGITADPVNRLFLVTDPFYCDGSQGSALLVYDEAGNLLETITGFAFAIAEPPVALDPAMRAGWAFGPGFNQLQQFFY